MSTDLIDCKTLVQFSKVFKERGEKVNGMLNVMGTCCLANRMHGQHGIPDVHRADTNL